MSLRLRSSPITAGPSASRRRPEGGPGKRGKLDDGKVIAAVAVSADGFAAGPGDGPGQPLGLGGDRLFTWVEDGDTPGRFYPWMKMSAASAAAFDGFIARIGAVITGRRTYDIAQAGKDREKCPAPRCSS
jgi:dihydrofolate reductase